MREILERFKSPVVITSILSFIFLVLNNLGVVELDNVAIENVIKAIITILVTFGILNNPTDKSSF